MHLRARRFLIAAVVASCAAAFCAFGEDAVEHRATGLLIPPHRQNITTSVDVSAAANALRRSSKSLMAASPVKSSDIDEMPVSWDSREKGWIGPVKNQGEVQSCWAFASYETLETQMRRLGKGDWDFSEKNMVNLHGLLQTDDKRGIADFAAAYLLRWGGAVAESNDVYIAKLDDWQSDSPHLNPPLHVQGVVWIPPRPSFTDNDSLKRAIMEYGAVAVPMNCSSSLVNSSNGSYYYKGDAEIDHLVTVIGWDDVYSKENFRANNRPPGDGAWLVKNSWGEDSGDKGYLHVSYYEKSFHMTFWCYGAVFLPAGENQDYSAVYGYDRHGPVATDLVGDGDAIGAVFTGAWNEELSAVGLYSCVAPLNFTISVYTNLSESAINPMQGGELAFQQSGTLTNLGFATIPLSSAVPLSQGEKYSVVFENTSKCSRYFCVSAPIEGLTGEFTPVSNVTYYRNNGTWLDSTANSFNDIYGYGPYSGNICMKAYTRSTDPSKDSGPSETADGSRMCADLAASASSFDNQLYAQAAETFGAFANIVGANSRSLWYSWMAGIDPSNPDDDFRLSLSFVDGVPSLSWSPDNIPNRSYTIYGRQSLMDDLWIPIEKSDLPTTSARFFKVDVSAD